MDESAKNGKDLKIQWESFVATANENAFHQLYTGYYRYLSYIGLKRGYSLEKIKDCFNDLFLYFWENIEKLKHVQNHHNYIITSFLRKLYRKGSLVTEESFEFNEEGEHIHFLIESSAEAKHIISSMREDASRILTAHVERLPEKQRQIIYQKFYLGLSYDEISTTNKISINTVYGSVYKAIDKLRTQLGEEQLTELYLSMGALSLFFLFFFLQQ
ncbi:MAG: sigma-70 family RNA polymerase sigma factor [Pedobacter sp.]|nr:MAG: sigma-70 family RNA polymerase sigma factor [Pedobacter sp.]